MCMYVLVHLCMDVWRTEVHLGILLCRFPPYTLRQGLSVNLELTLPCRLPGQQDQDLCVSAPSSGIPASSVVLDLEKRVSRHALKHVCPCMPL